MFEKLPNFPRLSYRGLFFNLYIAGEAQSPHGYYVKRRVYVLTYLNFE